MLDALVRRSGLLNAIRKAMKEDTQSAIHPLHSELKRVAKRLDRVAGQIDELTTRVETLERDARRAGERAARKKERTSQASTFTTALNEQQRGTVAALSNLLDSVRVIEHIRRAIATAPLFTDPYPHTVVEELFPDDVYGLLLEAIPPAAFFGDRDPIKQNLRVPMPSGPDLAVRVWQFVDEVVARQAIQPAVTEKFGEALAQHYDTIFGAAFRERACHMPLEMSGGRLMLRRPGYHLAPHRDPKRSIATCLLYLAQPGDRDVYGTEIYRVVDDGEASYTQTYYPEQDGRRCELVKVVPYRPNTMLAFLNSRGAHGASIPADAPADLERYTCQFYLGPESTSLSALIDALPPERQALWRSKVETVAM